MKKPLLLTSILLLLALNITCALLEPVLPLQEAPEKEAISPEAVVSVQATDTPTPLPTKTPTITPTATQNYQATQAAEETNIAAIATDMALLRTQEVQPMADLVGNLYQDGYLSSTEGIFTKLDDFDEQWAQLDWYRYWYLEDKEYADFVLSFSAEMHSASEKANWHHAGCGVVFRHVDNENHMFLIIAQNGIMSLRKRIQDWVYLVRDSKRYGSQIPVENVDVNLIVEGTNVYVFADGNPILKAREPALGSTLRKGRLAFSVMSGTNRGYGTRCSMTNIWLWEPKVTPP